MNKVPSKIAVIGVGLIGGSIALGLKRRLGNAVTIAGSCKSEKRAREAQKRGIIDTVVRDMSIAHDTELLILATPITKTHEIVKRLELHLVKELLTIDVGSTKETLCTLMARGSWTHVRFLGTHPMAGSDRSGFEAADSHLFRNKPWILCPTRHVKKSDIKTIEKLIRELGAKPIQMDPKMHDTVVSFVSHLPLSLSSILVQAIVTNSFWKLGKELASTGFRDMTRLAGFHPNLKADILLTNKDNTIASLKMMRREIDVFCALLKMEKKKELIQYLTEAKQKRDQWFSEYFS